MKSRRSLGGPEKVYINISPMIDMVFILLIFFVVTTVFIEEEGLEVSKPQPSSLSNFDNETVIFRITKSGQVFFRGREVGLSGVRTTVRNEMQHKILPVVLEVESEASSGIMVRVMDEVKVAAPDSEISSKVARE